jgi:hypothetical protein
MHNRQLYWLVLLAGPAVPFTLDAVFVLTSLAPSDTLCSLLAMPRGQASIMEARP